MVECGYKFTCINMNEPKKQSSECLLDHKNDICTRVWKSNPSKGKYIFAKINKKTLFIILHPYPLISSEKMTALFNATSYKALNEYSPWSDYRTYKMLFHFKHVPTIGRKVW